MSKMLTQKKKEKKNGVGVVRPQSRTPPTDAPRDPAAEFIARVEHLEKRFTGSDHKHVTSYLMPRDLCVTLKDALRLGSIKIGKTYERPALTFDEDY